MSFLPGGVVTVDFPGAAVGKIRPAIVVSTNQYQSVRPDVVLALCTTRIAASTTAMDYVIAEWQAAGLSKPTAVRMYFTTIPQSKVLALLGYLSDSDWQEVQARLRLALAV
jgi:mRNA-degrading endonuclease toxin of MazEF toxin-antitoxin module